MKIRELLSSMKKGRGLLLVITAAVLIELLSGAQYYQTHRLLESELEKRAESELMMKAIMIRSTLKWTDGILRNHAWNVQRSLTSPDSVFGSIGRIVGTNDNVRGAFVAFVPDYYPSRGRLFEPYAMRDSNGVQLRQIAGPEHDYTHREFYRLAMAEESESKGIWVKPYMDNEGASGVVTSCVRTIHDGAGKVAGVMGVDIALDWLSDTINVRHIYPSSFNLLLTEDGEVIAAPAGSRVNPKFVEEVVEMINDSTVERYKSGSGRSKIIKLNDDGREGIAFYANIRGRPHWQIAVVCYDDEVYASLKGLRLQMLLLMLAAFAILLFIIRGFVSEERKLNKRNIEQERLSGELRIASSIQQSMIGMNDDAFAGRSDVSVWGELIPAREVGGDLYSVLVRDEKLFFCIGDVSGKGVPSALIMAVVQSLFQNIARRESNPANIMTQLNEAACRKNDTNIFVTLFAGVLDLPSGHLRFCNAGHEMPVLIRGARKEDGGSDCEMLDVKANLPIGLFDDFAYEMQEISLQRGDILFLYTDGLTESRNSRGEQFGSERLMHFLKQREVTSPRALVDDMTQVVRDFSGSAEQRDDLTMLSFLYSPVEESSLLDETIVLGNDVEQVSELGGFVKNVCERLGIERSLTYKLRLAIEEAVVNVMEYAYPKGQRGDVNVRITSNGERMKIVITDNGIAFNPTEFSSADIHLSAEDRPVGGLGILLVRKLMDTINYERTKGKNVLTLRMRYKTPSGSPQ